jgi:hypothetical protein
MYTILKKAVTEVTTNLTKISITQVTGILLNIMNIIKRTYRREVQKRGTPTYIDTVLSHLKRFFISGGVVV